MASTAIPCPQPSPPGRRSGQRGASFLEALLAMALLSIIVSGVLTAFPRGFHHLKQQSMAGVATYLVRQKVDYYMAKGYNNITGVPISRTEYLKGDGSDKVDDADLDAAGKTTFSATSSDYYIRTVSMTSDTTLNVYVLTVKVFRRHTSTSPGYDTANDKPLAQVVTYIGNPGSPPV